MRDPEKTPEEPTTLEPPKWDEEPGKKWDDTDEEDEPWED